MLFFPYDTSEYLLIENFMLSMMHDSAHDVMHVYRVFKIAMHIAERYEKADRDVLAAACLLHDIGRDAQFKDPELDHAIDGAFEAEAFLLSIGWSGKKSSHVKDCISSHRWRNDLVPDSIEAKILFDADKLDVCGAVGIARTLMYLGKENGLLYTLCEEGTVLSGKKRWHGDSFFREYHRKLKDVDNRLFTNEARHIAKKRKKAARDFHKALKNEVFWCNRISMHI